MIGYLITRHLPFVRIRLPMLCYSGTAYTREYILLLFSIVKTKIFLYVKRRRPESFLTPLVDLPLVITRYDIAKRTHARNG